MPNCQLNIDFTRQAKVLCRTHDPESSLIAAEKMVKSGKINSHERIILKAMKSDETYTFRELAFCCGLTEPQTWRRLSKLADKNKVKRGDIRKCTISGELMTEWSILEQVDNER